VAEVAFDPGERINAGQVAVTLADDTGWLVETKDLTELDVVRVQARQNVTFTLDALPGTVFSGTVTSIAGVFVEKQGDVTYLVKIAVDETYPQMRWGMTAAVTFAP
jgi:multidrug resistance efflux pump